MKHKRIRAALFLVVVLTLGSSLTPASADMVREGTTSLVSTFSDGTPADGGHPSVSQDGRYVAFDSWDRLATEDIDDDMDVYRKDMQSGSITLVSTNVVGPGGHHLMPSISGDGNKVAYLGGICFYHFVLDELPSCVGLHAFVKTIDTGVGIRLYSTPSRDASEVRISRDGSQAVISQESGDSSSFVVVAPTDTGVARQFSWATCDSCGDPSKIGISANGRFVVYDAQMPQPPVDDFDGDWDVYLYDRDTDGNGIFDETGKTSLKIVGIDPSGVEYARHPTISEDGRHMGFTIAGHGAAVYVRDLVTQTTRLASRSSQGIPSQYRTDPPLSMGASGGQIAFTSLDPHLAPDTNPGSDVFLHDFSTSKTSLVSLLPDGTQGTYFGVMPSLSSDGTHVAFATALDPDYEDEWKIDRRVYLRRLSGCSLFCPF